MECNQFRNPVNRGDWVDWFSAKLSQSTELIKVKSIESIDFGHVSIVSLNSIDFKVASVCEHGNNALVSFSTFLSIVFSIWKSHSMCATVWGADPRFEKAGLSEGPQCRPGPKLWQALWSSANYTKVKWCNLEENKTVFCQLSIAGGRLIQWWEAWTLHPWICHWVLWNDTGLHADSQWSRDQQCLLFLRAGVQPALDPYAEAFL